LKRLIVTADDFGAAREVNDAVEAASLRLGGFGDFLPCATARASHGAMPSRRLLP
jgi:hypothetical protein